MQIPCLLDANSIIKYYFNLRGSEIIKYLFNKSPTAKIYIANVQVLEVISTFYKFRREGAISTNKKREEYKDTFLNDIKDKKILMYDFVNEHILDFFVYEKITHTKPPSLKPTKEYIAEFGGFVEALKEIADTGDTMMLMIARDIDFREKGKSYLFTSDGHVLKVADALKIKAYNSEKMSFKDMPPLLDRRSEERHGFDIEAICIDCKTNNWLCAKKPIDVSCGGVRIGLTNKIELEKNIIVKFTKDNGKTFIYEIKSKVVSSTTKGTGIKYQDPQRISLSALK